MARTIQEIFGTIQAARAADPVLSGLSSPSATAVHRLWSYITAVILWAHENIFERHKADVELALARAKPGTAAWYADQALLFQQGDGLIADDAGIHYAPGSTGAKIITRATAKENEATGKLFIKVAKAGLTPGSLAALSPAQLTQVKGYFNAKRFAGTRLEVVSREADRLKVVADIHYNPLTELATLQAAARAAVAGYLAGLEFDGLLFLAKLTDALQAVPGVKDVQLTRVSARAGSAPATVINRVYETQAGYIIEDDAPAAGLLTTLNFIPYGS